MYWFFIALAAPFLWATVNISDQYLVARYSTGEHSSGSLVIFSSLIGVLAAVVIGILNNGVFVISVSDKLILVLTGVITIAWVVLYLFALKIEDVSSVVPWFLTVPIFGYVLGYIFLGEKLSFQQIIGSFIVLSGVPLISIDFQKKRKLKGKIVFYMLTACLLISISGVIFKYVAVGNNFWVSSFWEYVGLGFTGILIYIFVPKYRKEFVLMNKNGGIKIFTLNTVSETLTIIGNLSSNYAILLAPVSLVYLVGNFQPAIVLLLTIVAARFLPHIVKENMSKQVLIPKISAIIIMIVGSYVLFL